MGVEGLEVERRLMRLCKSRQGAPRDGAKVQLPARYSSQPMHPSPRQQSDLETRQSSWQQREADLGVALQWLRQEIKAIREQDRQLARQFLSLRSTIRHLGSPGLSRDLSSSFSSAEDLSLADSGSSSSLAATDYSGGEFRARTQSLLEPLTSPKLSLRRSRTKECF